MPDIIIINGPPRAGKDTVGQLLQARLGSRAALDAVSRILKERTHALFGMTGLAHDAFESVKDVPLAQFDGRTPRQAYIQTSEVLEALFGPGILGTLFVKAHKAQSQPIIVVPGAGRPSEVSKIIDWVGPEHVLLVHLLSDRNVSFLGDSRSWLDLPRVNTIGVRNRTGDAGAAATDILDGFMQHLVDGFGLDYARDVLTTQEPDLFLDAPHIQETRSMVA